MEDKQQLCTLIVEDSEDDALLIARHLRQSGFDLYYERVDTAAAMKAALTARKWDLLLVDYKMPGFSGLEALNLVNEMKIDLPFILVSGVMVEETAVEAMRRGARDCIRKDGLDRLAPTIKRELEAVRERFERAKAQEALKKSHANLEKEVIKRTNEFKKAKEEAEAASKSKSEFLANISHELRNPMHQILSYTKYGIDKIDQPKEKLLHYFNQSRMAAERLMVLLNDLLDLSKMESGRMNYSLESSNIYQIVNEAVAELKPAVKEKMLLLEVFDPSISTKVKCDYYKVGQIIRNLLSNAIKFTPEEKKIEIKFSQNNLTDGNDIIPSLQVSVRDQGIGIPEDELNSVFDKFTQSSKTKTGAGGTGLGLAICKEIIKAHGGKIWAENNHSEGSTFCFLLPYSEKARLLNIPSHSKKKDGSATESINHSDDQEND